WRRDCASRLSYGANTEAAVFSEPTFLRLPRVDGWPQVTEPLLRERQGMSTEEFLKLLTELLEAMPARELDDEQYERAIGYPWERRPGSCLVTDEGVEDLEEIDDKRRHELAHGYVQESADRVPVLTYGANGSPERLA